VRNEKRLAEWYNQQKEHGIPEPKPEPKEAEYEYDDTSYRETIKNIEESIEDSVDQGIKQAMKLKEQLKKKEKEEKEFKPKKNLMWTTEFDEEDEEEEESKVEMKKEKTTKSKESKSKSNSSKNVPNSSTGNETVSSGEEVQSKPNSPNESTNSVESKSQSTTSSNSNELDLNKFSSAEELETLGLETLKKELQNRGLLCGGTLKERASRLFSIKGKSMGSIDPKIYSKPSFNFNKRKPENNDSKQSEKKAEEVMLALISCLLYI